VSRPGSLLAIIVHVVDILTVVDIIIVVVFLFCAFLFGPFTLWLCLLSGLFNLRNSSLDVTYPLSPFPSVSIFLASFYFSLFLVRPLPLSYLSFLVLRSVYCRFMYPPS